MLYFSYTFILYCSTSLLYSCLKTNLYETSKGTPMIDLEIFEYWLKLFLYFFFLNILFQRCNFLLNVWLTLPRKGRKQELQVFCCVYLKTRTSAPIQQKGSFNITLSFQFWYGIFDIGYWSMGLLRFSSVGTSPGHWQGVVSSGWVWSEFT